MPSPTYTFTVEVTAKNDGLTQDATRPELAAILTTVLETAFRYLPWVVSVHIGLDIDRDEP